MQKAIVASRQGKEIASQWQNGAITVAAAGAPAPATAAPTQATAAPAATSAAQPSATPAPTAASTPAAPQRQAIGAGGLAIPVVLVIGLGLLVVVIRRRHA